MTTVFILYNCRVVCTRENAKRKDNTLYISTSSLGSDHWGGEGGCISLCILYKGTGYIKCV